MDIAFHLFNILKNNDFAIQVNRFGAVFTQVFPLLGSKLGWSLSSIMQFYSSGFIVYHFGIFVLSTLLSKSYKFGLAMLLFSTLLMTYTYYWIQSELIQGIGFLILFFGLLYRFSTSKQLGQFWVFPIVSVMLLTLVFFHPLLVFPFLFLAIFFYWDATINRDLLKGVTLTFVLFYGIKTLFFKTNYDSQSMEGLDNFWTYFPNYFAIPSNADFLNYLVSDYQLFLLAFLLVVGCYIYQKRYLKLSFTLSFFFAYLLLINVSYPGVAEQFYIESLYLPLSFFLIFPLVFDHAHQLQKNHLWIGLSLVLVIRLAQIYAAHEPFTQRVEYMDAYRKKIETMPHQKLIFDESKISKDTLLGIAKQRCRK